MLHILPIEIVDHIVSFVHIYTQSSENYQNRSARRTLHTLTYVNSTFARLLRPLLYASIDIDSRALRLLLRTIAIMRPENADLIECLRIRNTRSDRYATLQGYGEVSRFTNQQLLSIRSTLRLSSIVWHQLAEEFESNTTYANIAVILSLCRNLRTLDLANSFWMQSYLIPKVLEDLAIHGHQRVSDLKLRFEDTDTDTESGDDSDNDSSLGDDGKLWHLPYLETFRGDGVVMVEYLDSFSFRSLNAPALRSVILEKSIIDETGISTILRHSPNLKDLSIQFGDMPMIDQFGPDYERIGQSIRSDGAHLRKLNLDIRTAMHNEFHDFSQGSALGSLASLGCLQSLQIPLLLLLGDYEHFHPAIDLALIEALPSSLQHFKVLSWPRNLDASYYLRRIVGSQAFPNLEHVVFDTSQDTITHTGDLGWQSEQQNESLTFKRSRWQLPDMNPP